jgi:hypothetical protein
MHTHASTFPTYSPRKTAPGFKTQPSTSIHSPLTALKSRWNPMGSTGRLKIRGASTPRPITLAYGTTKSTKQMPRLVKLRAGYCIFTLSTTANSSATTTPTQMTSRGLSQVVKRKRQGNAKPCRIQSRALLYILQQIITKHETVVIHGHIWELQELLELGRGKLSPHRQV